MNKRGGVTAGQTTLRTSLAMWLRREWQPRFTSSLLPGSALPGSALPGSALPGSALPGSALPRSALLVIALLSFASPAHAASSPAPPNDATSSHGSHRTSPRGSLADDAVQPDGRPIATRPLPVLGYAYSSELALAVPDWVLHPSIAFGIEFPRGVSGRLSYFPTLRAAYEYHADFQQRISVGAVPALRYDFHRLFSAQFGIEVGGVYLRSLWSPHTFDEATGTWSRGEGEARLTWQVGPELTLWTTPFERLGFGLFYGITVLYPLAPANDVPALPLTKLGLCGRWVL